jgi:type VI secretion system protein ImpL
MKDVWKLLAAGAALVAWLMLAWFAGVGLHLEGSNRIVLVGGLALVGIIIAAAFLYWSRGKQVVPTPAGAKPAPKPSDLLGKVEKDEIDLLIRQAEHNLKSSQVVRGATIADLPAVLLIGEAGAAKTTTMLKSGLEPEALAGQAAQGDSIVPTPWANLWFARNTVFVEAGSKVVAEAPAWARMVRLVAPAKLGSVLGRKSKTPRAAVVCMDCELLTKQDSSHALMTSAKNLRARLSEMSQLLGISFPVYVLFAKADRIRFFDEYVKNFSNPEIAQIFGVTLPLQPDDAGIYIEQQTKRVSGAFDDLFHSLSDQRIEFLPREYSAQNWPAIYEFPREFRKLQTSVVEFLLELCRPSQLRVGPFLRGFYFTGRRTVVVETRPSSRPQPPATPSDLADESPGATQVFDMRNVRRPAPAAQRAEDIPEGATQVFEGRRSIPEGTLAGRGLAGGTLAGSTLLGGFAAAAPLVTRTEQQWVFLSHLFSDVLLQDHAALGASGSSSKVSFWQRFLLVAAAVISLVFCVGFTVSYFGNRSLVSQVADAQAASFTPPAANLAPALSDLQRLNEIRQFFQTLGGYERDGRPFRLGWGLYAGRDLYPQACQAYARGFGQLLMGPTQAAMAASLKSLTYKAPYDPAYDPYDQPYNTLETYLITTGDGIHAKEDPTLAADLYARWSAGRTMGQDQDALAKAQFDFYTRELIAVSPQHCLDSPRDAGAVGNARVYLNSLPAELRIYQAMLSETGTKVGKGIDFKPFADQVVTSNYIVPPAFTKDGWTTMTEALRNPGRYGAAAVWVLGDQTQQVSNPQSYQAALQQRYQKDFIGEWRSFIKAARFKNSPGMIDTVIGARSALLMVFCLAAQNTVGADADVKDAFSVPRALVPDACETKVIGPPNKDYTDALYGLQNCLQKADLQQVPQDKAAAKVACQPSALDASNAVKKLVAQNAGPDHEVNNDSQLLLLDPIDALQGEMKAPPPPGAGDLCKGLISLSTKFPNQATLAEFEGVFGPEGGLLGKFKPPTEKANPRYVKFYNAAAAIQKALYPDGKTLQLHYTVTALASPGVNAFNLTIGNQSLNGFGQPKDFVWRGDAQETVQLSVPGVGPAAKEGSFDIFRFAAEVGDPGEVSGQNYTFSVPVNVGRATPSSPRLKLVINAGPATVLFRSPPGNLGCTPKVGQ